MRYVCYTLCTLLGLTNPAAVRAQREATDQRVVVKLVYDPVESPESAIFLRGLNGVSLRASVGNLMGEDDICKARLYSMDGIQWLGFRLTKPGIGQLHKIRSKFKGRKIAVVVDGRVWAEPIIVGDEPGDEWFVAPHVPLAEQKELAAWINRRAMRCDGDATEGTPPAIR